MWDRLEILGILDAGKVISLLKNIFHSPKLNANGFIGRGHKKSPQNWEN